MGFLLPAFLAGFAALAIPVWIHLRHREKKGATLFPSLMFLRRIPYREVRRQQLHHLPLFLLRALLIALLVAAFARPYFRRAVPVATIDGGSREVVILLDRSWSMEYGTRWSRALADVRETLTGLDPADRATLVLFDTEASVPVRPGSAATEILPLLDTLRPGPRGTRFGPALKVAQDLLAASEMPRKELRLVSDFQRSGWPELEEIRLPTGTAFEPVALGSPTAPDALVASVDLRREGGSRVVIAARVLSRGADLPGTTVSLTVNDRVVERRTVDLPADQPVLVTFPAVTLTAAGSRGIVTVEGTDSLSRDNTHFFTVQREDPLPVLLAAAPVTSAQDPGLFLMRALAIPGRPALQLDRRIASRLGAADVRGREVIIVHDAAISGAGARAIEERVREGAGLLLFAGPGTGAGAWPEALRPARIGAVVDRSVERGGTMAAVERNHPVFELFRGPETGDFSSARFFRYRRLDPVEGAEVLARFDDGAPALVERTVGRGRVLAFASPADNTWNDLPVQPVFLPFVHEMMVHVAGYRETPPWHRVGEVAPVIAGDSGRAVFVNAPDGTRERVTTGADVLRFEDTGFYRVVEPGVGGREVLSFAANVDVAESEITPLDPEELAIAIGGATGPSGGAEDAPVGTLASGVEQERRQRIWWYLLVGVALLAVTETVVGNRLSGIIRRAPAGS